MKALPNIKTLACALVVAGLVMFLAGCPAAVSDDPEIALAQTHAGRCAQMDQGIQTGLMLAKADVLSQAEIDVVHNVRLVYEPICTGEPMALDDTLKNAAAIAAIGRLCPELEVGDDVIVTIAQATTCAARKALTIYLLEHQS